MRNITLAGLLLFFALFYGSKLDAQSSSSSSESSNSSSSNYSSSDSSSSSSSDSTSSASSSSTSSTASSTSASRKVKCVCECEHPNGAIKKSSYETTYGECSENFPDEHRIQHGVTKDGVVYEIVDDTTGDDCLWGFGFNSSGEPAPVMGEFLGCEAYEMPADF